MRIPRTSVELTMDDPAKFAELTEKLLAHVEAQQETIKQMQSELSAHSAALCEMLAWLRQKREADEPSPDPAASPEPGQAPEEEHAGSQDRRTMPRRKGNPVSVLVSGAAPNSFSVHGIVVDRSPDGLCLIVEQDIPVGTKLLVRPAQNLIDSDWFPVEVRSSRAELKIWVLGCRFLRRLTWSNLRLFG